MDSKTLIETATAEGFEAFLSTKQGSEVVGLAHLPKRCPISSYLRSLCPEDDFVVGPNAIAYSMPRRYTTNVPAWMQRFIRLVDANSGADAITAQMALQYLKS